MRIIKFSSMLEGEIYSQRWKTEFNTAILESKSNQQQRNQFRGSLSLFICWNSCNVISIAQQEDRILRLKHYSWSNRHVFERSRKNINPNFTMDELIRLCVLHELSFVIITWREIPGKYQSRFQSFVPLDLWSENKSSGSIHFERTKGNNRILVIRFTAQSQSASMACYGACLKWLLPELLFSDRWSRVTKFWERVWEI